VSLYGPRRNCAGSSDFRMGIEVDRAKVEIIEKLPPPTNVKAVRSFLGHARFYRRFIRDFQIAKPSSNLLLKDVPFDFSHDYLRAFETLKKEAYYCTDYYST